MNKLTYYACILFFSITLPAISQSFTIDDTQTPQQLIENILFNNGVCEEIDNTNTGINGNVDGLISYGTFDKGTSDFPLQSGVVIATGSASAAQMNTTPNIGEGNAATWGGSTDLETTLGIANTVNATELSFDFTPSTIDARFNYILSSDEYGDVNPNACTNNDAFAILIREKAIGGAFTNITTLPGNLPVTINNLHPQVNNSMGVEICPGVNDTFFGGFRSLTSNQFPEYNGRTNVLTTISGAFTAGTVYEVKFIIADDTDRQRDSAAFIETFDNNLELTLNGTDALNNALGTANISTCSSNITLMPTQSFPPSATFQWDRDSTPIIGETSSSLVINTAGMSEYTLTVNLGTTTNGMCTISQSIQAELITSTELLALDIQECIASGNTSTITLSNQDSNTIEGKTIVGSVSYHNTLSDAISNVSPLPNSYNATDGDIIFGRFTESGGCLNTRQYTINIDAAITLTKLNTSPFMVCDFDTDGFEGVDTNQLTSYFFGSGPLPNNTTLRYYTDITRGTEYTGQVTPSTTLIAVLTDDNSGCDFETTAPVIINIPQGSFPSLPSLEVCDDTDGNPRDGIATFDILPNFNAVVTQNAANPGITVTFHSTIDSAERNDNIITPSSNFRNQPAFTMDDIQGVGVRVEDSNGCIVLSQFELRPRFLITNNNFSDINQCDNIGDLSDGIAEFNFTNVNNSGNTIEQNILGLNSATQTVTIHLIEADALTGANPLDTTVPFTNTTTTSQVVYARVEETATSCFDYDEIVLNVNPGIIINPITTTIEICNNDGTTGTRDNLVTYFNDNVASLISTETFVNFSYHISQSDADNNLAAIDDSFINPIIDANNTMYVRVTNPSTDCFETTSFEYLINRSPVLGSATPILICYDNTITTTPTTDISVNLATAVTIPNVTVSYYMSFASASADVPDTTDEITNPTTFEVLTDSDSTIWYRVVDNTTGCISTLRQDLIINERPDTNASVTEIVECEIAPTDNIFNFLLSTYDTQLLNGQLGVNISYYRSLADADSSTSPIDKTVIFPNTSNPQTIAYRIESDTDSACSVTSEIELKVGEFTAFNRPSIQQCDSDLIAGSTFDLPTIINEITLGTTDTFTITFHSSVSDAQNNINPLADTADNTKFTTDREIFDVVARIQNSFGCREFPTFQFQTFPKPEVVVEDFEICDVDQNGSEIFNLVANLGVTSPLISFTNTRLIPTTNISFFETNAVNGMGRYNDPIPSIGPIGTTTTSYRSTDPQKEIFIELTTDQGCYFQTSVMLNVNPIPELTPQTVRQCEDILNSNEFTIPDLSLLNSTSNFVDQTEIDSGNLSITYFTDAAGTNEITTTSFRKTNIINEIYASVQNTRTLCVSEIQTIPLVALDIPEIISPIPANLILCDDDSNGQIISDLTMFDEEILNPMGTATPPLLIRNATDFTIKYFDNSPGRNEITATSTLIDGETYIAEITDNRNTLLCSNSTSFTLTITRQATTVTPNPIQECSNTNTTIINFNDITNTILQSETTPSNFTVTYHNSVTEAESSSSNTITTTVTSNNYIAKVTNNTNSKGCYKTIPFEIVVNRNPEINTSATLEYCENDTSLDTQINGISRRERLNELLVTDRTNVVITYHIDNASAIAGTETNALLTTLFVKAVRTFSPGVTCQSIAQINLTEIPTPIINSITDNTLTAACDRDGINDGNFAFNFTSLALSNEILGTQNPANYTISYHRDETAAMNGNAIPVGELIATGTYYVKLQQINASCFDIEPIQITIDRLPDNIMEDVTFCSNDPDKLITANPSNPSYTYLWEFRDDSGAQSRNNETTESITLNPNDVNTNITLTITNTLSVNNCDNSKTFRVLESKSPVIKPIIIKNFESQEVTINVEEEGEFLYGFNDNNISNAQESNTFSNLLPGKFTLYVFDVNGCEPAAIDVVFVDYHAAFTPNGSGPIETETWHIQGVETIPETLVYIYNRYGKLLKTLTSRSDGWDGTYNGLPLSSDDYWILIRLADGQEIKDHITLKR